MSKPGRNDPCPCGSGRKYKRCCLGREAEHDAFAARLDAEVLPLLSQLAKFAEKAARAPLDAVARKEFPFWRPPLDDAAAARVVDFLIFDARLEYYGRTAVEQFKLEREHALDEAQQSMLAAWSGSPRRLYRAQSWSAGFIACADLLSETEQTISVWPLGRGAGLIADGAPIALRALAGAGAYVCVGRPTSFGTRSAERIVEALRARHLEFVRTQRIVGIDEYLRIAPKALDEIAATGEQPSAIILPGA